MEIIVFILLAGVWAAFLLPSFFEHRRQTPGAATRDFARSKQLLASVSTASANGDGHVRRHAQVRRRRILLGLFAAALTALVIAVVTGSVYWLAAALAFDIAIGGFVTMALSVGQRDSRRESVVRFPVTEPVSAAPNEGVLEETPTVRVIAG